MVRSWLSGRVMEAVGVECPGFKSITILWKTDRGAGKRRSSIYFSTCLLFSFSFFSRSLITSRPFMSSINVFLCLLGASRAVSLFIDPYHLKDVSNTLSSSALYSIKKKGKKFVPARTVDHPPLRSKLNN